MVTAGIELAGGVRSPYPKGLLIGQVVDVQRDANDVVQTAFLEPAADLDQLEYVLVITDYEGGLPPIEEQPIRLRPGARTAAAGGRAAVPPRLRRPRPQRRGAAPPTSRDPTPPRPTSAAREAPSPAGRGVLLRFAR